MRRTTVAALTVAAVVLPTAVASAAAPPPATAPSISLSVLPLAPGSIGSNAQSINARGQVDGDSFYPADFEILRASQWTDGKAKDLNTAATSYSDVKAQNNLGVVVGTGVTTATPPEGASYIWRKRQGDQDHGAGPGSQLCRHGRRGE